MKIQYPIVGGLVAVAIAIVVVSVQTGQDEDISNKIRVAYFPNIGHAVPIVGIENGIFSDGFGNETRIETRLFDSGPQVIEALFAKSLDVAYVGPGPAINGFLQSQKNDVKILAGAASGGASFIVHPDSSISSAADLSGKRIAAPPIGNTQDVSVRNYLVENNLKPAEQGGSVFIINVSNPDIYTLFVKGEIDAAWISEPWATILVNELGGTRLFHEEDLWPEKSFASVLLVVRPEYLEQNPDVVEQWLESHSATVNWINSNPEETSIIFNKFLDEHYGQSIPEEIVRESLSHLQITDDSNEKSIHIFAERADSLGYLGRHGYDLQGIFYDEKTTGNEL